MKLEPQERREVRRKRIVKEQATDYEVRLIMRMMMKMTTMTT